MHCIAGVLLVADFALLWILDRTVVVEGLDYVAWASWFVALILLCLPMVTFRRKGQVPSGKGYVNTEALVDTGIYAVVRHPQYLGWMLMYLVVLLFNPNWVLAMLGILGVACVYCFTRQEEQRLVGKFGASYRRYMQAVPRFNLAAGVIRLLLKQRVEDRRTP
jgi:protein-S-isoprenylcysteine O-methyltransferase Ste14